MYFEESNEIKTIPVSGMTALMIAAEYGFVKVEKRIWLYTWNTDVLDEFIQTDEKIVRKEPNRTESKTHKYEDRKHKPIQDGRGESERPEDGDGLQKPSTNVDEEQELSKEEVTKPCKEK